MFERPEGYNFSYLGLRLKISRSRVKLIVLRCKGIRGEVKGREQY